MRKLESARIPGANCLDNVSGRHFEMSLDKYIKHIGNNVKLTNQNWVIPRLGRIDNRRNIGLDWAANGAVLLRFQWWFTLRLF